MSVDSIGARIAAIQSQIDAITGSPPAAAGFDQALASASSAPSATSGPVAVAASALPAGTTPAGTLGGGAPSAFDGEIQAAARKYGLDPALLKGLIRQESNFNPAAGSPAGAQGLTQLMPGTARALGVTDPHDPQQAIDGGARYLKQQLDAFGGDVEKALAAYNAGPGAVKRYGGVPPYAETQNYVKKVMGYAQEYRGSMTAAASAPASAVAAMASPIAATPVASSPNQFGIV